MSSKSFLNFLYSKSRKPSQKQPQTQLSFSKERQIKSTNSSSRISDFQPTMEEIKRVFNKFDMNKDGKISLEEYKMAQRSLDKKNSDNEFAKGFQAMDSDGDGSIDFKEFMELYNMEGGTKESDIRSVFKVFDMDGDGKISAEELMEALKMLGERSNLKACRQMVKGVDRDGDGFVDVDEFINMMSNKKLHF